MEQVIQQAKQKVTESEEREKQMKQQHEAMLKAFAEKQDGLMIENQNLIAEVKALEEKLRDLKHQTEESIAQKEDEVRQLEAIIETQRVQIGQLQSQVEGGQRMQQVY